jgi:hypothetical protein
MDNNLVQQQTIKHICGAKTRRGHPCKTAPVIGRKRCRMHGGTNNGAPKGSQNALKHGRYTAAMKASRKETMALIRQWKELLSEVI